MVVAKDILLRFREVGLSSIRKKMEDTFKTTGRAIKSMGKSLDNVYEKMEESVKNIDLSFLSLLFSGYALQQMSIGLFRTFSSGWMNIESDLSQTKKQIVATSASFEYMKFVIFDIIATSPAFQSLLDNLRGMAEAVANFAAAHPKLALIAAGFLAIAYIIGTILVGMGLVMQGIQGLATAIVKLSEWGVLGSLGEVALAFVAIAAAIMVARAASKEAAKNMDNDWQEFATGIGELLDSVLRLDFNKFVKGLVRVSVSFADIVVQVIGGLVKIIFAVIHFAAKQLGDFLDAVYRKLSGLPAPIKKMLGITTGLSALRTAAHFFEVSFNPKGVDEAIKSFHDMYAKEGIVRKWLDGEKEIKSIAEKTVATKATAVKHKEREYDITKKQLDVEKDITKEYQKRYSIAFKTYRSVFKNSPYPFVPEL